MLCFTGPAQSTPFEDIPLHPRLESHLKSGRIDGSQPPVSPLLAPAHPDTAHHRQQEQEERSTTASTKPATLNTNELNSPTYHTWSSPLVGKAGQPLEAQGLQVVHSVGNLASVGRTEQVAQLRRDVRKAVKQEMRTIVKELMQVSDCSVH